MLRPDNPLGLQTKAGSLVRQTTIVLWYDHLLIHLLKHVNYIHYSLSKSQTKLHNLLWDRFCCIFHNFWCGVWVWTMPQLCERFGIMKLGSWYDRNALKTPIRSGTRPRSLLLQKVDEDSQEHSRSFLAGLRARSRSISSLRARSRSSSSPRPRSRSISSLRARSRSIFSLEQRMLVDERLQLEEERRRFLLRKRKQKESKR